MRRMQTLAIATLLAACAHKGPAAPPSPTTTAAAAAPAPAAAPDPVTISDPAPPPAPTPAPPPEATATPVPAAEIKAIVDASGPQAAQLKAFATKAVASTPDVAHAKITLKVNASSVVTAPSVACKVSITVFDAKKNVLSSQNGGAKVEGSGASAESDCYDAVIGDLVKRLGTWIQQNPAKVAP